jgi:hypothetical protein
MGMQDAHVRLMHLHHQAMGLEPDFCVNPMRTSGVEDAAEDMTRSVRSAHCAEADAQKQDGQPRLGSKPFSARVASEVSSCQESMGRGDSGQGVHGCISKKQPTIKAATSRKC